MINGLPVNTFATPSMINMACEGIEDRVLVLVQLTGGNDGINTVIPIEQYDTYRNLRPGIGLPDSGLNAYIPLDNTLPLEDQVGLHPEMTGIKNLYDQGKVNIVQSVSYDNQNRSHFKSTDLWMTGGDGTPTNFNHTTGWMGRFLNYSFPGLAGNPTQLMPDPLGIQLGNTKPSLGFHTNDEHNPGINLTGQDLSGFYNVISEIGGAPLNTVPQSDYGEELQFIMNIENSVSNYAQRITTVFNQGSNAVTYPDYDLANQLKTVARLMNGGCMTKIYLVRLGGFDTHANQVMASSPTMGNHAELMRELSESVSAFISDLEALSLSNRVLTLTFSEFGRKPIENGDLGTDHGTAAPMLLFGPAIEPGITGTNVNLVNLDGDQLASYQHDYRQVYTTVLQDWLGAGDDALTEAYFSPYIAQKLPLITSNQVVDPTCYLAAPLPVSFLSFYASATDDQEVLLEWETESEPNNDRFELERSGDGSQFEQIGEVPALGFANSGDQYEWIDRKPLPGISYYRLRQVDQDGKFSYSEIRAVELRNKQLSGLKIYPNPARYDVQLVMNSELSTEAEVKIFNTAGSLLRHLPLNLRSGFNKQSINIDELTAGNYLVQVESTTLNFIKTLPLVKQ